MRVFDEQCEVALATNSAGQLIIPLFGDSKIPKPEFKEILMTAGHDACSPPSLPDASLSAEASAVPEPDEDGKSDVHESQPSSSSTSPIKSGKYRWIREDWGLQHAPVSTSDGPSWKHVTHRTVRDAHNQKILFCERIDPLKPKNKYHHKLPPDVCHTVTEFHHDFEGKLHESCPVGLTAHQVRQVHSQVKHGITNASCSTCPKKVSACKPPHASARKVLVIEVFSPPRFKPLCEEAGFQARSIDLLTGHDLTKKCNRAEVEQMIIDEKPDLLVLCPPCTDEGGWFHLNSTKWDRWTYLQRVAKSRSFIRWCTKLFRMQTDAGRQAILEHPTGAKTWSYPEVQTLCKRFFTVKCHMCQYGLKLPDSPNYIRKSTRLLVSHEEMKVLERICPGKRDPKHCCHDVVAGTHPKVGRVSVFAGQYTTEFVKAVLQTVPSYAHAVGCLEALEIVEDQVSENAWQEVLAARQVLQESKSDEELMPILLKLHRNLGHPGNADLVRILRHGQASEQALTLARSLQCSFCQSHAKPHAALPAHPAHVTNFNEQIGIDVKHLPGWRPNQKVLALNIVDTASSFQRMIPFFEVETSRLLWQLLKDHWIAWAGPPREVVLDPKATNLGEPIAIPLEQQGVHIRPIAAEAHYQLGKVESHGGWFERVLKKIVDEHSPQTKEEWLECVTQAHVKNTMIQNHGVTPHQFIFGRNPSVPSDLLSEPLSTVAATASTVDAALAKAEAIRTTARHAIIQLQDSRAMRVALLARPRVPLHYEPGALVAYWRCQKWVQGKLVQGGQWYGTAVVLGHVGRNLVLAHRKQILRAAPEQLRPATSEERQLLGTPGAELLGIKDLIEGGAFKSQQYVDLTSQAYPSVQPEGIKPEACTPDVPMPPVETSSPSVPPSVSLASTSTPSPALSEPYASVPGEIPVSPESSSYGPVRRKVTGKNGPDALWRPPSMRQEDFVSIMKEVVPRLIEEIVLPSGDAASSHKRPHESASEQPSEEPDSSRARLTSPERSASASVNAVDAVSHECMFVQCLDSADASCETLIAAYLKKKLDKELHHSNNPENVQSLVDAGKRAEWVTLMNKGNVVKLHYGKAAERIKRDQAHRFIGSRFVLTRKPLEEGAQVNPNDCSTFTVKGRWCLQGHLDPDLDEKALTGRLQSPTLNQLSRMTLMQIIASHKWNLQLGDIKGAFLESGMIEEKYRPLYASMPPGGIPGVDPTCVTEVLGNVYGQNDAPAAWFATFDEAARSFGWVPSS
eukprot:s2149_g4.t1